MLINSENIRISRYECSPSPCSKEIRLYIKVYGIDDNAQGSNYDLYAPDDLKELIKELESAKESITHTIEKLKPYQGEKPIYY